MRSIMPRFVIAVLLLMFIGSGVHAEQVLLKNGDRLTGAILSMDGKKLVLKTTYEGEVSIEWDSVEQFTSDQPLVVTREDKKTVIGTVQSEGINYVVTTPQGDQTIAKSDVAGMRSLADQATYEKALHPGMLEAWSGGGNFGFETILCGSRGLRRTILVRTPRLYGAQANRQKPRPTFRQRGAGPKGRRIRLPLAEPDASAASLIHGAVRSF